MTSPVLLLQVNKLPPICLRGRCYCSGSALDDSLADWKSSRASLNTSLNAKEGLRRQEKPAWRGRTPREKTLCPGRGSIQRTPTVHLHLTERPEWPPWELLGNQGLEQIMSQQAQVVPQTDPPGAIQSLALPCHVCGQHRTRAEASQRKPCARDHVRCLENSQLLCSDLSRSEEMQKNQLNRG